MATRPPPLLLTKRLTSFLHLNLSATITTLLLLTPSGKLLAYASRPPVPVATLRTHGTVAASLYAIHSSGTDRETIDAALGPPTTSTGGATTSTTRRTAAAAAAVADASERDSRSRSDGGGGGQHDNNDGPLAVTIQLESGSVLVIRRLRCGMLFVCMGPPDHPPAPPPPSSSRPQTQQTQQQHQQHQQSLAGAISQSAATSAPNGTDDQASAAAPNGHNHHHNHHHHQTPSTSPPGPSQQSSQQSSHSQQQPTSSLAAPPNFGSPSEAASVLSSATAQTGVSSGSSVGFGAGTAGVMVMRRHAEELARWLDDKLGTLEVPGDGLGGVL